MDLYMSHWLMHSLMVAFSAVGNTSLTQSACRLWEAKGSNWLVKAHRKKQNKTKHQWITHPFPYPLTELQTFIFRQLCFCRRHSWLPHSSIAGNSSEFCIFCHYLCALRQCLYILPRLSVLASTFGGLCFLCLGSGTHCLPSSSVLRRWCFHFVSYSEELPTSALIEFEVSVIWTFVYVTKIICPTRAYFTYKSHITLK